MEILTSVAEIMAKGLAAFFIHLLVLCAMVSLAIVVGAAYAARYLWRFKSMRAARGAA